MQTARLRTTTKHFNSVQRSLSALILKRKDRKRMERQQKHSWQCEMRGEIWASGCENNLGLRSIPESPTLVWGVAPWIINAELHFFPPHSYVCLCQLCYLLMRVHVGNPTLLAIINSRWLKLKCTNNKSLSISWICFFYWLTLCLKHFIYYLHTWISSTYISFKWFIFFRH